MQDIIKNQRGTRAFDRKAGTVVALGLAVGLLSSAAPAFASPLASPIVKAITHTGTAKDVHSATGRPDDVTLDFVAADINDVLKALSVQTHTNIVSGSDVKGAVTVSLAHVTLDDALEMITKLSGFEYAKVGRTYVVGTPTTIATLTSSGTAAAPPTTAIVSFTYSQPDDLTSLLKQTLPNLKITPGKAAGTGGSGGVLMLTGSESDIAQARQEITDSEVALSRGIATSQTVVYNIKYASADDLQTVLGRLVPNLIVTPGPTQRQAPIAPTTADAGGTTSTTTSYGATSAGSSVIAVTGNLPVKPTTSSLLLTGSEADIARAQHILAQVDTRPAQINYEARVTDLNLDVVRNLGLNWDFSGANTTIGESGTYPGRILKFGTFSRTPLGNAANVSLDALFNDNDVKILADPNISALDGQQAATFVGDTITYVSSITTGPTGQNITTATVNAGIKLFVTGKVNNDGYITLNLHPEVSTATFQPSIGGSVLPDISTREATTTLRVKDGDTVVIGGLINDQDTKNIKKVPLLGDLPFFGALFRDTQHDHRHREVIIFLKVSIQKDVV